MGVEVPAEVMVAVIEGLDTGRCDQAGLGKLVARELLDRGAHAARAEIQNVRQLCPDLLALDDAVARPQPALTRGFHEERGVSLDQSRERVDFRGGGKSLDQAAGRARCLDAVGQYHPS